MSQGLEALRVLLVDDNQHMRAIVATILKSAGITDLREAANGTQALLMLKQWPVDVAFIDYQMSPMDGLELTRKLRDQGSSPCPYLPIIMMTGYAERPRVVEARDAGVTEFLVKPITAKAVLDRLNVALFKPRPFVQSENYFGPTRRRSTPDGETPQRRAEDRKAESA